MSVAGVRREKAALSSGCKPHPATAPAGSNRSSHGGNEMAEAFGNPTLMTDAVKKYFGVPEQATLIHKQRQMRNVDSRIPSL